MNYTNILKKLKHTQYIYKEHNDTTCLLLGGNLFWLILGFGVVFLCF